VLDFVNEADDIYQAFKPYYESTPIGENADPHRLTELQYRLLEWAVFTSADVDAFATVWYRGKWEHSGGEHKQMNAVLDAVLPRFTDRDEDEQDEIRSELTAFRNLYAFLSQIIPYQDSELKKLYAFVRNLLAKLPPPGDGQRFELDDEVALRYFRLQQMIEGSIDLGVGDAYPLKGPTDVGTGGVQDDPVELSILVDKLNERFGTDFTEADQLFFDQIRASAQRNERIVEAARANSLDNFSSFLERMLDELFIERMEGNEEIFSRVMSNPAFRTEAQQHLAREIFDRVRQPEP
jgi:type I restriction enzyme R subunit